MGKKNPAKVQLTLADKAARKRAAKAEKAAGRAKRAEAKAEAKASAEARREAAAKAEAERQAEAQARREAQAQERTKREASEREGLTRLIVSQERDWCIRLVFKRAKRRGAGAVPSVFVTRTGEMADVAEARVSADMRARVTQRTGTTASGDLAPLTFGEAWKAAHGLAGKVGADVVSLATGERFSTGTRERVA